MPTNWKLRELLKERGVKSASEISRSVRDQTGYQLSIQAICDLLNAKPRMIRLETIQAICDSFYIRLSDFLEVLPSAAQKPKRKTRSVGRRVHQTDTDEGGQRVGYTTVGGRKEKVDFAAFYPDARSFRANKL
jgi:putative transcriptional regulator